MEKKRTGKGKTDPDELRQRVKNKNTSAESEEIPPSQQIDAIIEKSDDWHGEMLSHLRSVIIKADSSIVEEVKWKKPSKPEGVAVWSHDGILCVVDILKNAVRLTFPKGAQISDPSGLFNTRLDSKTVRAVDFHQGDTGNEAALSSIILEAIKLNSAKFHR